MTEGAADEAIHFRGFALHSGNVAHMVSLGGCLWELTVLANLYRNCAANLHWPNNLRQLCLFVGAAMRDSLESSKQDGRC